MEWLEGLEYEEWEDRYPEKDIYLHGKCDEWVLENFKPGDIAVIWNEFNPHINRVCIIHCYIKRNNGYVDVRGFTKDLQEIQEPYDWYPDNSTYECTDIEEFKQIIRKICGYTDKKWR